MGADQDRLPGHFLTRDGDDHVAVFPATVIVGLENRFVAERSEFSVNIPPGCFNVLIIQNAARADPDAERIHMGAKPTPMDLTPEMAELAIKSSEVTNLEVSGVDILETKDGLQVIEVNSIPGWKGLQQVVPIDIPAKVVDYLLEKINK